jgi:hypothetical protein
MPGARLGSFERMKLETLGVDLAADSEQFRSSGQTTAPSNAALWRRPKLRVSCGSRIARMLTVLNAFAPRIPYRCRKRRWEA